METSEGISDDTFSDIKSVVSRWYDDNKCISMLKVVYKEHLTNNNLFSVTKTIDILNFLYASGDLSSTDLTLLYDTINITKQRGLEKKIRAVFPSFPNVREFVISRFSRHRQNIVEFGHELNDNDIEDIDGKFNTPKKDYPDRWSMISDLEYKLIICESSMDTFVTKLKKLKLVNAVKTLQTLADKATYDTIPSSTLKRTHQTTVQDIRAEPKEKRGNVGDNASDTHRQQPITDISKRDYRRLLTSVSRWWELNGNIHMLKVLLRQFRPKVNQLALQKEDSVMDLFTLIEVAGELSTSNIAIIFEAVKLCGIHGVASEIQSIVPSFQSFDEVDIRIFTPYRQKLIKFGNGLDMGSIKTIGFVTSIKEKVYQGDQWRLICELEDKGIIKENSLAEFIQILRENDMDVEAALLE